MLFGYTLNYFASRYGVAYQFLYPEYRGENNPLAFALVGFALGGFVLAFNLYTYILHGFRFPFIATLNRPFQKFSVNNFVIPLLFVVTYIFASGKFQRSEELLSYGDIAFNLLGFVAGMFIFLILSIVYFRSTNKNIRSYSDQDSEKSAEKRRKSEEEDPVKTKLHRSKTWHRRRQSEHSWRVETYMVSFFRVGLARSAKHYRLEVLRKVFNQNHINASLFELALIVSFIVIGSFGESDLFVLPSAASVLLLSTMMLMFVSVLHTWIRGWTLTVFLLIFLAINYSEPRLGLFNLENQAYGMDYSGERVEYNPDVIRLLNENDSIVRSDFEHTLGILNNWRRKNQNDAVSQRKKPKMVIINTSGGGSRSAVWTMASLLNADSLLDGQLLQHTAFISGSSGGMIGAAYIRELYLREQKGEIPSRYDPKYVDNMAKDLLNPVIFSIATNDFFIRYQKVEAGGFSYTKDRAWAFEKQLHRNTDGFLDKTLGSYALAEQSALIPMMVMAPTIVNDGRRLLVSSQPCAYLAENKPVARVHYEALGEDVEFRRLFGEQQANQVRFSSALRMNATFPYVMPIVSLPSNPPVEVMDAGLRDNFGTKTTLQFLYTFRNWINTNTSGVVIIQIRDVDREAEPNSFRRNLWSRMTAPLGSVYGNFTRMQDYNNDQMIRYLTAWFENSIDIVTFQLEREEGAQVSLSWHLTTKEKEVIKSAVKSQEHIEALDRLKDLLD